MISGGSADVATAFHNFRKIKASQFYCFHTEICALLQDFLSWIETPLLGHLGIFTVPAVVDRTSRWEVRGCFFQSAFRHLVDNMTISGTTQGKGTVPDRMQGPPDGMLRQPFHVAQKTRIDPTLGSCAVGNWPWGGVNISPFLEETLCSCLNNMKV